MSEVDQKILEHETTELAARAQAFVVVSSAGEQQGALMLATIASFRRRVEDEFNPHIARANKAHKGLVASKRKHLAPLDRAKITINGALREYQENVERARLKEQRRLQEIADKEAADQALERATALEAAGEVEAAEHVLVTEAEAPPVVLPPAPKPQGLSYRTTWHAEIVDDSMLPRKYLMPDKKKIDADARSFKADADISGVRVYSVTTPVQRR